MKRRHPPLLECLEDRLAPAAAWLDPTFAGAGKTAISIGAGQDVATDVTAQADGKYLAVGWSEQPGGTLDFAIARFNSTGFLDGSFGTGGKRTVAFDLGGGREDRATFVRVLADGKILVAGFAQVSAADYDFAICRLNPNGSLDGTFGNNGIKTISFGAGNDRCFSIALVGTQILLAGIATTGSDFDFAVCRLNADGSLDATFGNAGQTIIPFDLGGPNNDLCNGLAVQPDGKLVLGGWGQFSTAGHSLFLACRLSANGFLDGTFGNAGRVQISATGAGAAFDRCDDVLVQNDGRIVLTGQAIVAGNFDFAVCRLTSNGLLDSTFAGDGTQTIGFNEGGQNNDIALEADLTSDGKIVVLGSADRGGGDVDFALCRLNANGSLDATFAAGGRGTVAFNLGGNEDRGNGLFVEDDDEMVVVGSARTAAGKEDIALARLTIEPWVVVTADRGGPPTVQIFSPAGILLRQFNAFAANFTGGVRVAMADINADLVPDFFCSAGRGGAPIVNVFDGRMLGLLRQIQVYGASFTLGVHVAVGDVLGDGAVELLVAPDVGGLPFVNVFNPLNGTLLRQVQVFGESYRLGVRLAVGDAAGDAKQELIVAPQAGGAPVVNLFNVDSAALVQQIQVFAPSFTAGLFIAAGNINGTGKIDLVVGPDAGGAPVVNLYETSTGQRIGQHQLFVSTFTFGVRVGVLDIDRDGRVELLGGVGPGGQPIIQIFDPQSQVSLWNFLALSGLPVGVFVAGGQR
jgi:uncharacterized delta-60 repeat protein